MDTEILTLLLRFSQQKILVIGDSILDVYIHGDTNRLSPEAPTAVVDVNYTVKQLGGAANVAANVASLGGQVFFCSVVGEDIYEQQLKELFKQSKLSTNFLVKDDMRITSVKTRVMAQQQAIVRYDVGDVMPLSATSESLLIDLLEEAYASCDAVIIADYDKGVITKQLLVTIQQLHKRNPKFIAVDSKRLEFFRDLSPSFAKPNYKQMLACLGALAISDRISQVKQLSKKLYEKTQAKWLAITLDQDGAVWTEKGESPLYMPANQVVNPHVCGAGDTYISAATLAMVAGGSEQQAATIASLASCAVVEKQDTSLCLLQDIFEKIHDGTKIITNFDLLVALMDKLRQGGKRIVFTNGCFDILHCGHTNYLKEARSLGDVLVVGVNTDESVKRLKGIGRPINSLDDRMDVLAAFSCVDFVTSFGNRYDLDNPSTLIRLLKPHIVVKGEDYKKKDLPEKEAVEEVGAEMILLPFTHGKSTTNIIRRIERRSNDQKTVNRKVL